MSNEFEVGCSFDAFQYGQEQDQSDQQISSEQIYQSQSSSQENSQTEKKSKVSDQGQLENSGNSSLNLYNYNNQTVSISQKEKIRSKVTRRIEKLRNQNKEVIQDDQKNLSEKQKKKIIQKQKNRVSAQISRDKAKQQKEEMILHLQGQKNVIEQQKQVIKNLEDELEKQNKNQISNQLCYHCRKPIGTTQEWEQQEKFSVNHFQFQEQNDVFKEIQNESESFFLDSHQEYGFNQQNDEQLLDSPSRFNLSRQNSTQDRRQQHFNFKSGISIFLALLVIFVAFNSDSTNISNQVQSFVQINQNSLDPSINEDIQRFQKLIQNNSLTMQCMDKKEFGQTEQDSDDPLDHFTQFNNNYNNQQNKLNTRNKKSNSNPNQHLPAVYNPKLNKIDDPLIEILTPEQQNQFHSIEEENTIPQTRIYCPYAFQFDSAGKDEDQIEIVEGKPLKTMKIIMDQQGLKQYRLKDEDTEDEKQQNQQKQQQNQIYTNQFLPQINHEINHTLLNQSIYSTNPNHLNDNSLYEINCLVTSIKKISLSDCSDEQI